MPPMPYSYAETTIIEALQKHGFKFSPRPTARNSVAYDGRPKCQGNSSCSPICPIGAQYAAISHVDKAKNAGTFIATETLVTRINLDASRNVETLTCRRADGSSFQLSAKMYVLAANGIETPKLMLASASERAPGGVGNAHDNVGRYFMDHPGVLFQAMMPVPVYTNRGPDSSNIFTLNRDGAFRKQRAGYTVSIHNRLPIHGLADKLLQEGHQPPELYEILRDRAARMIELDGHFELLPQRSNRVQIDPGRPDSSGMPGLTLHYEIDDYTHAAVSHFHQLARQMCDALGADLLEISPIFAHHHLMGTTRMGRDPKVSVTDENCRVHGHQNLFVAGSSVFTTGGTANPTLTIAALSLRLATHINSVLGAK